MDQEVILTPSLAIERIKETLKFRDRYDNFIGGKWVKPQDGSYFDNITPISGTKLGSVARSKAADIELAIDAAHKSQKTWAKSSPVERSTLLLKVADRLEANLNEIAIAESLDNGKPIRETMAADIPLAVDHLRYFAACIRTQEGALSEIDHNTVAYHFHEPLGSLVRSYRGTSLY